MDGMGDATESLDIILDSPQIFGSYHALIQVPRYLPMLSLYFNYLAVYLLNT